MTISAKVVADSISPEGIRLTTLQLRYPRFIHAELMTHRVFSRNASSSRAIPVERMIEDVLREPVFPSSWGKNQRGMQAREELNPSAQFEAKAVWAQALMDAVNHARKLVELGAHKQLVNRLLEPFAHINVMVTATDWANFFALRRHPDAQPEIKALADAMWEAMQASTPKSLQPGQWHLPYVRVDPAAGANDVLTAYRLCKKGRVTRDEPKPWEVRDKLLAASVARIARVSFNNHDGSEPDLEKDTALHDRLLASRHMSPFEHQATPDRMVPEGPSKQWEKSHLHGNLRGWIQYRKLIPHEYVSA